MYMSYRHTFLAIACFFGMMSTSIGQDTTATDNSWKTYPGQTGRMPAGPDTVVTSNDTPPTLQNAGPGKTQVFQDSRIGKYGDLWTDDVKRSGYRILIYQGKSSEESKAAKTRFFYKYEDQKAYADYLQPHFRVLVGDFRTRLEAEEYLEKLRERYPSAYIIKSEIQPVKLD